jgi:hypothetical protein
VKCEYILKLVRKEGADLLRDLARQAVHEVREHDLFVRLREILLEHVLLKPGVVLGDLELTVRQVRRDLL